MDRLRATMPPSAAKVALHQFQPLPAPPA